MGTFTQLSYHIVFGTKFRRQTIRSPIRDELYDYVGGTVRGMNGCLVEIRGIEDHIHLLINFPPTMALSDAVRDLKANSSKWMSDRPTTRERFEWQTGYAAFTVSFSQREKVAAYLRSQEEHHKHKSFKEEYIEFLKRHNISFEEKYLFDVEHVG